MGLCQNSLITARRPAKTAFVRTSTVTNSTSKNGNGKSNNKGSVKTFIVNTLKGRRVEFTLTLSATVWEAKVKAGELLNFDASDMELIMLGAKPLEDNRNTLKDYEVAVSSNGARGAPDGRATLLWRWEEPARARRGAGAA
eukprot:scaffold309041_cov36-Prasinocladus_malaysianus.AAC.2